MKIIIDFKVIIFFFILSITENQLYSQDLPIMAVVDNNSVNISHIAKSLDSKLNSAIQAAGLHSEGEEGLYFVGHLIPISDETVETGMRKIYIKNFELSLRLENPQLGHKFGSLVIPLKGFGFDSIKATIDAIKSFNPTTINIQNFITASARKAQEYYKTNIDGIIDRANTLTKSGQYDAAIALLWACPNNTSIHNKVYKSLEKIYLAKQNHNCSMLLKMAENAYAQKNFSEMAKLIEAIDADSPCASQAASLAKKAAIEIRKDDREQSQREEREKERAYSLEEKRIDAISRIAKEYLKVHKVTYHYFSW